MKKYRVTMERLKEFCAEHDIAVPSGAMRPQLEAAIARSWLHLNEVDANSCFGYWEDGDMNCHTCGFENMCFEAALGTTKARYFKFIERDKRPVRFESALRKRRSRGKSI